MSNQNNPKTKTSAKTKRWSVIALGAVAVTLLTAPLTCYAASAALDGGHFFVRSSDSSGFVGKAGMSSPAVEVPDPEPETPAQYTFGNLTFGKCEVRSNRLSIFYTGPFIPDGYSEEHMQMEVRYLVDGEVVREEPMTESWKVDSSTWAETAVVGMNLVRGKSVGAQIRWFDDFKPDTRTSRWMTVELADGASNCTVR